MPSDVIEHPNDYHRHETEPVPPPKPKPADIRRQGSSSADDLGLSLASTNPDPMLGEFEPGFSPAPPMWTTPETDPAESSTVADDLVALPEPPVLNLSPTGDFEAITGLPLGAIDREVAPGSTEVLPAIDLNASPQARPEIVPDDDQDDVEEAPARGLGLGTVLLLSYASAVTLGLLWVLWTGRHPRAVDEPEAAVAAAADDRADPGTRANHSRKFAPRPPVPAEHILGLGETIKLGVIEVTPLRLTSGQARLVHIFGQTDEKSGGDGVLKLRLRLRNTSADTVLAPLDEAFLRDRPGADPDSEIEPTKAGEPPLAMYPLAIESEWGLAGQVFRDLKPGESFETEVVTTPGSAPSVVSGMLWRVRLRTNVDHTDDLGVRIDTAAIKAEPKRPKDKPRDKDKDKDEDKN